MRIPADGSWRIRVPGRDGESPLRPDLASWLVLTDLANAAGWGEEPGSSSLLVVRVAADAKAPAGRVLSLFTLLARGGIETTELLVRDGDGVLGRLPWPPPPTGKETTGAILNLRAGGADEVRDSLQRLYLGAEGRPVRLSVNLETDARVEELVLLLTAARRYGFLVSLLPNLSGDGGLHLVPGTTLHSGELPDRPAGVVLSPAPETVGRVLSHPSMAVVSGRAGHRNLRAEGGGTATFRSVDAGLAHLSRIQREDGGFPPDPGEANEVRTTSLALLAFLASGETPTEGKHQDAVGRALEWLLAREAGADPFAARALAEAYGLTRDPLCRAAAIAALARLDPADPQAAVTRAIARLVGIPVDPASIVAPTVAPAVTAALVRLLSGEPAWVDDDLRHTCESLPDLRPADALAFHDVVLAAFQAGGAVWKDTNAVLKNLLVDRSFAAESSSTAALHTATLAVYYRYSRLLERK